MKSESSYTTKNGDASSYSSGYEVFLARTNFREVILGSFKTKIIEDMRIITKKTPFKILDIGCGNGQMTEKYVSVIRDTYPDLTIEIDLVEPAADSLEQAGLTFSKKGILARCFNQTGEEFSSHLNDSDKCYDLIIASYVFYHIKLDVLGILAKHTTSLGSIVIAMGSHDHPLRKHPLLRAISKHGDSNLVEEAIIRLGLKNDFEISKGALKTNLDLNNLISKNEQFNLDGVKLLSFIYNTEIMQLNDEQSVALNQTLRDALTLHAGFVHPVHNLYWLKRLNK